MISKKDKLKAVQTALGTKPDGIIGSHTADVLYRQFASPKLPYEGSFFGCKVMIGDPEELQLHAPDGAYGVKDFTWSMSGSFTWPAGVSPISFMFSDGSFIRDRACHANTWDGEKPESVLYYTNKGEYGIRLARTKEDLEDLDLKWAIGGGQITPHFNNVAEGFTGRFSDVFRKTAHCAIGFDKYGNVLGAYVYRDTLNGFQTRLKNMGMELGIFVDGGHISAINAGTLTANTSTKQGYIIQF